MSALLLDNDLVACRVWCQDLEQASVNTFNFLITNVTGNPVLGDLATDLQTFMAAAIKALINNGATYKGFQLGLPLRIPQPVWEPYTTGTGIGTAGANALPRQACGLFTHITAYSGPANRGRTYLPFPSTTDDAASGVPNSSYQTRVATLTGNLLSVGAIGSGGNTATATWVVHSRVHGTSRQVDTAIFRTAWATQKKRGTYGRPNNSPI